MDILWKVIMADAGGGGWGGVWGGARLPVHAVGPSPRPPRSSSLFLLYSFLLPFLQMYSMSGIWIIRSLAPRVKLDMRG